MTTNIDGRTLVLIGCAFGLLCLLALAVMSGRRHAGRAVAAADTVWSDADRDDDWTASMLPVVARMEGRVVPSQRRR